MVLYKYSDDMSAAGKPLATSLFFRIQKDILTDKLKKGEKLTEQRLCNEYGISRTPVREALKQLEIDGLVESIPNRGAFVIGLSKQDYEDLFDLRKIYEIQAVKWAIERITTDEMDALEETFEFMEFYTMKNDYPKMLNINNGFHRIIYKASHNRMLAQLLSSYQVYTKYINLRRADHKNHLQTILEEHRRIFHAFTEKDIQSGAEAMSEHIGNSKKRQCD